MLLTSIKTDRILPGTDTLEGIIAKSVEKIEEGSILAVTSKVVSLCENRVIADVSTPKEQIVWQESDYVLAQQTKSAHQFTIRNNTLIPSAGIDESNGGGCYVLWPEDVQRSANAVRQILVDRFRVEHVGVIITDSTCTPLRWGTTGIALAHSGFVALKDYVGQPDLFGRNLEVTKANIAGGLAAAAVVAMGEGAEQTPICLIEDVPFVSFQDRNPSESELAMLHISIEEDLFSPFLTSVEWHSGGRSR